MTPSREDRIRKAYLDNWLNIEKYNAYAEKVTEEWLHNDARRDITTEAVLKKDATVYGIIKAKERGVLAGLTEVLTFYARHNIKAKAFKKDGDRLKKGEVIAELKGNEIEFLKVERTGLNILERMSGIATQTKRLADIAARYGAKIVGTRKTVLNYMDKKAIVVGGGFPHRMGLHDAILIKDNHLSAIREEGVKEDIETAIERAYVSSCKNNARFIEVEVSNPADAIRAATKFKKMLLEDATKHRKKLKGGIPPDEDHHLELFPCIIMFDNMKSAAIRKTVDVLKRKGLYDYVLLEASGGVTEKTLKDYASSGIDVISIGALTHSVRALDINQKIIRKEK
jgi:nicotinate-nucleotide pyrophosphorylase (carboxylating)